jgi:hypothetical protein
LTSPEARSDARAVLRPWWLIVALVGAGILLRLGALLENPPLGLDEARLAINIGSRSYGELLRPLEYDQSAPLLYLWAQRTIVDLLGMHDWALRLLPVAFGVGLVLLVPWTLGRLLGARPTAVATAVVAFSPLLIQYSISVKQYGVEAALTLLVVGLALRCREGAYRGASAVQVTAIGTLLPWLMAPAAFVLVAVAGCALADLRRGLTGAKLFLIRSVPAWAISCAVAYLVIYAPASRSPYLRRYWSSAMLSPGDGFPERFWALLNENLWGLALGYPGPPGRHLSNLTFLAVAVTLLLLMAAGCGWLRARFGWSIAVLAAGPFLAAVAGSLVGVYPLGLRLTLFEMPLVQLLLVSGLERVIVRLPEVRARRAWVVVGSAFTVPLAAISLLQVQHAGASEDVRTLVAELSRRRQQEPLYVFTRSIPPWVYYSTDWASPERGRLDFASRVATSGGAAFENAPSRARVERNEGDGLEYRAATGLELYGLATGIEWTPNLGPLKYTPDSGWSETEAQRLMSLDAAAVWVLMSHLTGSEGELHSELERRGMCATYVRELDNAMLIRYVLNAGQSRAKCLSHISEGPGTLIARTGPAE